jgi:ATP-dependent DNA ligase
VDLRSEVDGYRALALKQGKDIRLLSLKEKNLSSDFPGVVEAVGAIGGAFLHSRKKLSQEHISPSFRFAAAS